MPELNSSSKSKARMWNNLGERVRRDFLLQVIAGTIPGAAIQRVSGIDDAVSVGTTPVWPGDGQYPHIHESQPTEIFSDNVNDTYKGTGAWILRVVGLDYNHEMQMEDVILKGTTPVITQGSYSHLYHATVLKAGTRDGVLGTITLRDKKDSIELGYVVAPFNRMMNGVFTVPAHTNAYLYAFSFNIESLQDVIVGVRFTTPVEENEVWINGYVDITSGGHQHQELVAPFLLPPLTDLELTAEKSGGVTATVLAEATLLLIDTTFEWDSIYVQDETFSISRPNEDE